MDTYTSDINGKTFKLKKTSPARLKQLDDASKMLRDWNEENDKFYLYDAEFRAKFLKKVADVIIDWDDGTPDQEFFESDELEVSEIVQARTVFLARAGVI